ncbi:type II toxin-antitoxin system HicB family antitoxin [Microbaculum marinum]|uniref:Type II toxin-antitoxin system HicB family antitoxin n=1 Tax=Microbaculum marinum TaxID=1764581 RepID=A0AAW9RN73_9HYPH
MNGYIALIRYPADSIEWLVTFPDLPGCRASGRSMDDALVNGRTALSAHLAEIALSGRSAPAAREPGDMLLAANDDPALAAQMVGAVLRVIEPEADEAVTVSASVAGDKVGFYGEVRRSA